MAFEHITIQDRGLKSAMLAIGAANDAVPGHFYLATNTNEYFYGAQDGSLIGPIYAAEYISTATDTNTIDLNVTTGTLTANVKLSAVAGQHLTAQADGIHAKALTIHSGSSGYLEIDGNYQLKVKQLLITDNTVDATNSTLSAHLTAVGYNSGNLIYQESDIIILTSSHQTWIQNGGTAGTTADFTSISADVTDSYIRNLFSGVSGVSYNPGTGVFSLAANGVLDTNLRTSVGTSVIGRSAGTTGNVADIVATANGQILRMAGGVLGFGSISSTGITAVNDQVFYGAGGIMAQSANLTFNGSALGLTGSLSVVTNVHSGVNYSGTATASVNGAYGVRYNHTLTANASVNHAASGVVFSPTLVAASNNNFLYGLQLNPTFTLGAFTGVTTIPLQIAESSTTGQTIRLQNTSSGATNGILLADNLNGQRVSLSYAGSIGHSVISLAGNVQNRFNYSNVDLLIQNGFSTRATYFNNTGYYAHSNPPDVTASGTVNANLYSILSFQPTSGTAVFNHAHYNTGINQTGGANGITRTIYINPTLTAAADYRAIESTNGKVVFGGAGASLTVGNGSFTHAAGIINATSGFRINDAASSGTYLRGNGASFVSSALLASDLSGAVAIVNGGTGLNALGTANQQIRVNGAGTALEYFTPSATSYTFESGLTNTSGTVRFGGTLTQHTTLAIGNFNLFVTRGSGKVTYFNTSAGPSGFNVYANDIEVIPANPASALNGYILTSENGSRFRIVVLNSGALDTVPL